MADDAQLVDSSAKAETEDTDSGQPDKLNEGDPDRADAATAAAKEAESAASAVASKKKLQRPSSGQMPASTAHKEPLKQRPKTGSNYKYKRDLLRSRDVQAIATELAKDAMVDRQNYLEMKTAHLSKVEEVGVMPIARCRLKPSGFTSRPAPGRTEASAPFLLRFLHFFHGPYTFP